LNLRVALVITALPFLLETSPNVSENTNSELSGITFCLDMFFLKYHLFRTLTSISLDIIPPPSNISFASWFAFGRLRRDIYGWWRAQEHRGDVMAEGMVPLQIVYQQSPGTARKQRSN
jgi:hypothetical protein